MTSLGASRRRADNTGSVACVQEIDAAIGGWAAGRTVAEVLAALDAADVPPAASTQWPTRGMLQQLTLAEGGELAVPGIAPKLSRTPVRHRRNAPGLGQDTETVIKALGPRQA